MLWRMGAHELTRSAVSATLPQALPEVEAQAEAGHGLLQLKKKTPSGPVRVACGSLRHKNDVVRSPAFPAHRESYAFTRRGAGRGA